MGSTPIAKSASTPPDRPDGSKAPPISLMRLANGLRIVVIPDHRAPVVTHMVWYCTAPADESCRQVGHSAFS